MRILCLMQSTWNDRTKWQSADEDFEDVSGMSCCPPPVLVRGVVVSPLSFPSYRELKRTKRDTCRRVRKLYINSCTSVVNPLRTNICTYKHNLRLRPPHNYASHAKAFGNYINNLLPNVWLLLSRSCKT